MKLTNLFPIIPVFSAFALLATPSIGRSDHKVTVYQDRDHDGHYTKKKIEVSDHHHHSYGRPYIYSRPYGYHSYGYGPSISVNVHRSYGPSDSGDLVVDVQRELRRRGYYRGSIDGDAGPGTRNAIRAYQYDRGLAATGSIDRSLLRSLGIG